MDLSNLALALLDNLTGRSKFTAAEIREIEAEEFLTDYQRLLLLRFANEVEKQDATPAAT